MLAIQVRSNTIGKAFNVVDKDSALKNGVSHMKFNTSWLMDKTAFVLKETQIFTNNN